MPKTVLFAVGLSWLVASPALAAEATTKVIRVCKTCPTSTVKAAIRSAASGDTIRVEPGHYAEGVISIEKSITIEGHGRPVVDGLRRGHVFYVRADNVQIRGLVIQNSGMSYVSDFAGIRAEHVKGCLFEGNVLKENTYAIYLEKVEQCAIKDNEILGTAQNEVSSGNGVHLFYSNQIDVRGNEIQGHRDGLYFEFTEDSTVEANYSHDNLRFGMHFMFSHRNIFNRNIFSENPTGVAVMYSRNLQVSQNVFAKSRGSASYGILVKEITDSDFIENTFSENTLAVFLNASNRNLFTKNVFILNGWAAEIYTNSYDNKFIGNNFISNSFDIATNSRRNTNIFSGNFWDHYRGYDFDYDNCGDVPYKPVSIFSFWVARFPELAILLNSPVVSFLEAAEHIFPVLTPESLEDVQPKMRPLDIRGLDANVEVGRFYKDRHAVY